MNNLSISGSIGFSSLDATAKSVLLDFVYPIGSYVQFNANFDTAAKVNAHYGGTWVKVADGYFIESGSSITTHSAGIPNIAGSFLIRYGTDNIGTVALSRTPGPFTYQEHYPDQAAWGNTLQRSTDDAIPSEIGFNAAAGEIHGNTWRNDVYGKSDTVQPKSRTAYIYYRTA